MDEKDLIRILDRLDRIIGLLSDMQVVEGFQPMSVPAESIPLVKAYEVESEPTLGDKLIKAGVDLSLIEIEGDVISPAQWLGDMWSPIDNVLKTFGYKWLRDGRNSRWQKGATPQSQAQTGKEKYTIKDPDAPATPKQLAVLDRMEVFIKEGLTKGEASRLIESKKTW